MMTWRRFTIFTSLIAALKRAYHQNCRRSGLKPTAILNVHHHHHHRGYL